ncbi:MAG: hypothetical protein HYW86_05115 [Candidatus Roizmanbacteria bacterium]|nr:MAG: hypothetical protein HYW86_05115 [Candidatus Roizmanbacteria bacterium]
MEDDQNFKKSHKGIYIKLGVILFFSLSVLLVMMRYVFLEKDVQKTTKASGESVVLSFTPVIITAPPKQEFTVVVKAKPSIDITTRGYSFKVNFDKAKVQLKDIEYKLGVVSNGLGDTKANLAVINEWGAVYVQGEIQKSEGQILTKTEEAEVITLTFVSNSYDPSIITHSPSGDVFYKINADYNLSEVPVAEGGGANINAQSLLTTTPMNGNIKLNLKLKFQGINSKPEDQFNKMVVKVALGGSSVTNVIGNPVEFTSDNNGVWSGTTSFNALAGGGYYLLVKGPKHTQKKICELEPKETSPGIYQCDKGNIINLVPGENNLNLIGVLLFVGDLPGEGGQDGVVNSNDLSLIRNNLGKSDINILNSSDVNLDGIINSADYSLIISALSIKVDEGE